MTCLSVNVNKIALLRNSRDTVVPSVTGFAQAAIEAGAHGITVHPRPDERHIRKQDVYDLSSSLDVEFNIEGNPTPGFMDLVLEVRPDQVTLVPDDPAQLTSDHGWNLEQDGARIRPLIDRFREADIRVSLFMDPDAEQIPMAKEVGADRVELYTESYARAHDIGDYAETLGAYVKAALAAQECGLGINAGHDLTLANLGEFCREVPGVLEVSIGHGLVVDALHMGWENSVKAYLGVLEEAGRG